MKCSFGVASCARIRSASTPPARKKPRLATMYMIPIRLWSTVVSQLVTRPDVHGTRRGTRSALAAIALLLAGAGRLRLGARPVAARLQLRRDVREERVDL